MTFEAFEVEHHAVGSGVGLQSEVGVGFHIVDAFATSEVDVDTVGPYAIPAFLADGADMDGIGGTALDVGSRDGVGLGADLNIAELMVEILALDTPSNDPLGVALAGRPVDLHIAIAQHGGRYALGGIAGVLEGFRIAPFAHDVVAGTAVGAHFHIVAVTRHEILGHEGVSGDLIGGVVTTVVDIHLPTVGHFVANPVDGSVSGVHIADGDLVGDSAGGVGFDDSHHIVGIVATLIGAVGTQAHLIFRVGVQLIEGHLMFARYQLGSAPVGGTHLGDRGLDGVAFLDPVYGYRSSIGAGAADGRLIAYRLAADEAQVGHIGTDGDVGGSEFAQLLLGDDLILAVGGAHVLGGAVASYIYVGIVGASIALLEHEAHDDVAVAVPLEGSAEFEIDPAFGS